MAGKKKARGHRGGGGRAGAGRHRRDEEEEDEELRAQQLDELTAMYAPPHPCQRTSAIFADDFELRAERPLVEYALLLRPHYSFAAHANLDAVSLHLVVRQAPPQASPPPGKPAPRQARSQASPLPGKVVVWQYCGYPRRALKLRVEAREGLEQEDVVELVALLHDQVGSGQGTGGASDGSASHTTTPSTAPSPSSSAWPMGCSAVTLSASGGGEEDTQGSVEQLVGHQRSTARHRGSGGGRTQQDGGGDGGDEEEGEEDEQSEEEEEEDDEEEEESEGRSFSTDGGTAVGADGRDAAQGATAAAAAAHLLRMVTSHNGPLPHALPALASQLHALEVIPQWVADLLHHDPRLIDRAFHRVFSKPARCLTAHAHADPSVSFPAMPCAPPVPAFSHAPSTHPAHACVHAPVQPCCVCALVQRALQRFWSASAEGEGSAADAAAQASGSRYLSDFEEVAMLGKGGFGSVVLCVNKLDGRKYAIKRIPLRGKSPALNSKILREVATLSRLQHQHVVRYYQAWFETGAGRSTRHLPAHTDTDSMEGSASPTASTSLASASEWLTRDADLTHSHSLPGGRDGRNGGEAETTYLYIQMEYCPRCVQMEYCPRCVQMEYCPRCVQMEYCPRCVQMEYCPRTLRQVLEARGGDEVDGAWAWRVVRQVVEGLLHVHGQGIIHRDLTPNNLFVDPRGDIKIGDFGLAKFSELGEGVDAADAGEEAERELSPEGGAERGGREGGPMGERRQSATGQVGTYFYTAPEVEQGWAHVDDKATGWGGQVDMWSVGVVLLECWHPFHTAMEHAHTLSALKLHRTIPHEWALKHPQVAELVRRLLSPLPSDRPSAAEVLRCDLMPPRMEDEALNGGCLHTTNGGGGGSLSLPALLLNSHAATFPACTQPSLHGFPAGVSCVHSHDRRPSLTRVCRCAPPPALRWGRAGILRAIQAPGDDSSSSSTSSSAVYDRVLAAIFARLPATPPSSAPTPPPVRTLHGGAGEEEEWERGAVQWTGAREAFMAGVQCIFHRHGALRSDTRVVDFAYPDRRTHELAVRVVDAQGSLLSLRYDTRLTFARWVAATQTSSLKRFQFSSVFRRAPGRRPPHDYLQADFDIVGGTPVLADAEAIKVAVEVVEGSGAAWGAVEVRLNHRDLLCAIWQWAGVTRPQAVVDRLQAVEKRFSGPADDAMARLAGALPPGMRSQGRCHQVCAHRGAATRYALTGALPPGPLVAAALGELGELLALLRVWGIHPACTTIDALMAPSHHYFSKCFFQVSPTPFFFPLSALFDFAAPVSFRACDMQPWNVHARHLPSQPPHHQHQQQHPLNPISTQRTTLPSDASLPGARSLSASPPSALAAPWSSSPPLCVAVGGRYDALLLHLSSAAAAGRGATWVAPLQRPHIPLFFFLHSLALGQEGQEAVGGAVGGGSGAVGFSVALHKLMAPSHPTTHHTSRQAAVDVLVCARGGAGLLSERMEVSARLWAAGIKAEYVSVRAPSLTEQYEHAHEHGIKWLVLLTDAGLHTHSAKVRHLDLKTEEEVSLDDLVKFFLDALPSLPTSRRRGATAPSGSGAA
ncbi:unnamed protein product [Closterium sp. Naga37s-1]|nr:unnamed protein product [Closterium sp. Naga37s-1]